MKNLFLTMALFAFVGTTSFASSKVVSTDISVVISDCEKCGKEGCKGDCKSGKKACCKKGEEKACCKKGGAEGKKACCKKGEEKACCKKGNGKAKTEEAPVEPTPAE